MLKVKGSQPVTAMLPTRKTLVLTSVYIRAASVLYSVTWIASASSSSPLLSPSMDVTFRSPETNCRSKEMVMVSYTAELMLVLRVVYTPAGPLSRRAKKLLLLPLML